MAVRKSRRKICFILGPSGTNGGGMGRVKDYILQSGGDRGDRVTFAAIDTRGQAGVARSVLLTLCAVVRIWAYALQRRVALVHVNVGDHGSLIRKGIAIVLLRLTAIPVVLHFHGGELLQEYQNAGPALRLLIGVPFRMATCCVVLGRTWHTWLTQGVGIAPERVEILYNGVPIDQKVRDRATDFNGSKRQLLFLGALIERKGLPELLPALAHLPDDVPDWRLTLAGNGDWTYWQNIGQQLGIAERLEFVGWVDQVRARELLARADLLVLPSRDEALPLVILEALGVGTPVLCTPVGAIPEVLRDGDTAVFVQPRDSEDLSRKLDVLIRNAQFRASLSRNGMALFNRLFTLQAFLSQLFDIYRRHCGVEIEMHPGPGSGKPD